MIKLGSAFSGIGAWEKALTNLKIPHSLEWCFEIDKCASLAYSSIHRVTPSLNKGDISKAKPEVLSDIDLFTYSCPCQSFSKAGKQQGTADPRGTLFFDALRIIKAKKPKVAVMENVKGLAGKRFTAEFKSMLNALEEAGYTNRYKILNSKDYLAPQHRERLFLVSIRKDPLLPSSLFTFPPASPLPPPPLRSLLEADVPSGYYISADRLPDSLPASPQTSDYSRPVLLGAINPTPHPSIGVLSATHKVYQGYGIFSTLGIAATQTASGGGLGATTGLYYTGKTATSPSPVRRLTPLESFRVMGFSDEDYWKAHSALSAFTLREAVIRRQLYKMAGNSVVVSVAEAVLSAVLPFIY